MVGGRGARTLSSDTVQTNSSLGDRTGSRLKTRDHVEQSSVGLSVVIIDIEDQPHDLLALYLVNLPLLHDH